MALIRQLLGKSKQIILNFTGRIVLVSALLIYGFPVIAGKYKNQLSASFCILFVIVIFLCSGFVLSNFNSLGSESESGETTQTTAAVNETTPSENKPDAISTLKPNQVKVNYPEGMLEKYKNVFALNTNTVGWLKVPNTAIDTAVVQCSNNSYYLKHDFFGNYTETGSLFLDYRNKSKDFSQNSVIYGHGTIGLSPASSARYPYPVFTDLQKYKDSKYFIENPIIEYSTLYADYEWKVFAAFLSSTKGADDNGYFFYYITPVIGSSNFNGYLEQIRQRSYYFTGVDVNSSDKILTLSTCSHDNDVSGRTINSRLVLVARLLRKDESKTIDASKVKNNPNFRRPQAWYDHYGINNPYAGSPK